MAARELSRRELTDKLRARGHAEGPAVAVVEDLAARGLLDEARLAEAYVRARIEKGYGPWRIREELREKGLSAELIGQHLDDPAQDWAAILCAAHDKKYGPTLPSDAKERGRRGRFLQHRGFSAELIGRLLRGQYQDPPAHTLGDEDQS